MIKSSACLLYEITCSISGFVIGFCIAVLI